MNTSKTEKRTQIVAYLVEGMSLRTLIEKEQSLIESVTKSAAQ